MKIRLRFFAIMLFPFGLLAESDQSRGADYLEETTKGLIESGAVTRVLIFHVPDSTMTRVALTPQALLAIAGSGYEITADIKERLQPVFSGLFFQKEKKESDLRWGLLFYDVNNREIGSVFVDKFGRYGFVNRAAGSFQSEPKDWNLAVALHRLTGDPR